MKKIIISILIIFLLSGTVVAIDEGTYEHTGTKINLICDKTEVNVGETFIVDIIISPHTTIDTVALDGLSWSANVEVQNVERGDLFNDATFWKEEEQNSKFKALVWGSTIPTTEEGTFCSITFKLVSAGEATIKADEKVCGVAYAGREISKSIENQVTINKGQEPPVPVPGNGNNLVLSIAIIGIVSAIVIVLAVLGYRKKKLENKNKA